MSDPIVMVDQIVEIHSYKGEDGALKVTLQMKVADETTWGFECWFSELDGEELIREIRKAMEHPDE